MIPIVICADPDATTTAVERLRRNGIVIDYKTKVDRAHLLVQADRRPREQPRQTVLRPEQVTLLQCAAAGLTNDEIADMLHVSDTTVRVRLRQIYRRLGVHNRASAVMAGCRLGVIGGDG